MSTTAIDPTEIFEEIIQIVEQNRHEDVGPESGTENARTMSSQQAYHDRPVAVVSHREMVRAS